MPAPSIIVAVGLPGSGKSSYFARIGAHPVSSDALRLQLADDETDQTVNSQVFAALRYLVRERIALRRPVTFIDATNLSRRERQPYIGMAREHGCMIEALWFNASLSECKIRNAVRGRVVPEYAMDQMAARLVSPSLEEGFHRVVIAPRVLRLLEAPRRH